MPAGWLGKATYMVKNFADVLEQDGYYVMRKYDQDSSKNFNDSWNIEGLAGIAFLGHGKRLHNTGRYYAVLSMPSIGGASSPETVNPKFKLSYIMAIGCGAYEIGWKQFVAPGGTFVGTSGDLDGYNFKKMLHTDKISYE